MDERVRGALTLLGFAMIAMAAFFGARYWQSAQQAFTRAGTSIDCDLRAGACRQVVPGGSVTLSIAPADIPLMKPLSLVVATEGLMVDRVTVDIRGLNMEMGLNRTPLGRVNEHRWQGETILPICSQRRMQWEAAVQLSAQQRIEVPFRFQTTRP